MGDGMFWASDVEPLWSGTCPSDLARGGLVLSGDVPDSCSHAEEESAQDPPRESGTHDPRHQASSEEDPVHVAQGLSGSHSCAWTPPAARPAD